VGIGEFVVCKALQLTHIIHHIQEALVEQSAVWQSNVKGLGGIIFWLDAVCSLQVVLLEVDCAA
jgi:hypothetical protein